MLLNWNYAASFVLAICVILTGADLIGRNDCLKVMPSSPPLNYSEIDQLILESSDNISNIWPNGRIPTIIDKSFTIHEKRVLKCAVQMLMHYSCIKFLIKRKDDQNYLRITKERTGCFSENIGMKSGENIVNLNGYCMRSAGRIIHNLMHSLGFIHEHSRNDRHRFINVHMENIPNSDRKQFEKVDMPLIGRYDYHSIMHWSSIIQYSTTKPRLIMTAKINPVLNNDLMGNREGPTEMDIFKINVMYQCINLNNFAEMIGNKTSKMIPIKIPLPTQIGTAAEKTEPMNRSSCAKTVQSFPSWDVKQLKSDRKDDLNQTIKLWPNATIPTVIEREGITKYQMSKLRCAINFFHENTCLRFVKKRSEHQDYLTISAKWSLGCFSQNVGYVVGKQIVNFDQNCWDHGILIHEILHAIGMTHENSRSDRDEYITIHYEDIPDSHQAQFHFKTNDQLIGKYDYKSIMHSSAYFGHIKIISAKMEPTQENTNMMGNRDFPTDMDVYKINKLYNCY